MTVLGAAASFPGAGQACAGYLVESPEARVLLDCGNGTLSNLGRIADPLTLDAVFITHAHPDHFADVYSMQAMLRYAPQGPAEALDLFCQSGLLEHLGCVLSERGATELGEAFVEHSLEAGRSVTVGDLEITPHAVPHSDVTFALRVSSAAGTVCYTSDTAYSEVVVEAARGADVLLSEATLVAPYEGMGAHLSAVQAGRIAREAGVGRLVLTHLWPTFDREDVLAEARLEYAGDVTLAEELLRIDV